MGCFIQVFDRLSTTGIRIKTSITSCTVFLKPLFGVFDLVAKAPVLNMMQFNGYYRCPSCLHPGTRERRSHLYLPGTYELRTKNSIREAAEVAGREGRTVNGVKGRSVLSKIINISIGAPIDYMHGMLEGVVKCLLEKWVKSVNHFAPYYIRQPNRLRLVYLNNDHPTTFQELHEPSPNIANPGRLANFVRGCCTILCHSLLGTYHRCTYTTTL